MDRRGIASLVAAEPLLRWRRDSERSCLLIFSVLAASLAAMRPSVFERARPKGISVAAYCARSVAPIESKLGTWSRLLAG